MTNIEPAFVVAARAVVTMDGAPIQSGAVVIIGNRIADVGPAEEMVRRYAGAKVIDLSDQLLLPGLINAHCHLEYSVFRDRIPRQRSFAGWIQDINHLKAQLTPAEYLDSIAAGFAEAGAFGTTSLVNLEAFPELISSAVPAPLRTWWMAEMIDLRGGVDPGAILNKLRSSTSADPLSECGLAPHAPYTASPGLITRVVEIGNRDHILLSIHLAESAEEMQMFHEKRGPLCEFLSSLGRDMTDCGGSTPLAHVLEYCSLDERWIVAHLNELTENDFALLAANGRFHVVHCPRSHRYFGHSRFPLQRLEQIGLNICLGTDSLASNSSLSLFAEMQELRRVEPRLSAIDLLQMVTVNAARAIGQQHALGRIRAGFLADLIAIPSAGTTDFVEQVASFRETVGWQMIDGIAVERRWPPHPQ